MEFNKPFILPALLGAETSAAEDENHWMLSLQFGELPAFRGVVGKLIVGDDSPWNNVRSHMKSSSWMRVAGLRPNGWYAHHYIRPATARPCEAASQV